MKCPIIKRCGGCFYPQDQYQEELKEKTLFIEKEIKKTVKNLKRGIPAMNKMFKDKDFNILLEDLEKYNSNVKQDYEDFQHVQVVWKKLKKTITENNKKLVIAQ